MRVEAEISKRESVKQRGWKEIGAGRVPSRENPITQKFASPGIAW